MTIGKKKTKEEAAAAKESGLRHLRLMHYADAMAAMLRVTARGLRIEAETGEECDESRQLEGMAADIEQLLAKIDGPK